MRNATFDFLVDILLISLRIVLARTGLGYDAQYKTHQTEFLANQKFKNHISYRNSVF